MAFGITVTVGFSSGVTQFWIGWIDLVRDSGLSLGFGIRLRVGSRFGFSGGNNLGSRFTFRFGASIGFGFGVGLSFGFRRILSSDVSVGFIFEAIFDSGPLGIRLGIPSGIQPQPQI